MDPDPRTTLGSLQSLPSDVLIRILLHMTIREVFVIMQVNRCRAHNVLCAFFVYPLCNCACVIPLKC